jgi:hypothetical protein
MTSKALVQHPCSFIDGHANPVNVNVTALFFVTENGTLSLIVAMIGRFFVTYAMNAGVQVS